MERAPAKPAAIYHRIQAVVAEEVPSLYMFLGDRIEVFDPRIKGLTGSYRTDAAV
jgi:hypothetical protein